MTVSFEQLRSILNESNLDEDLGDDDIIIDSEELTLDEKMFNLALDLMHELVHRKRNQMALRNDEDLCDEDIAVIADLVATQYAGVDKRDLLDSYKEEEAEDEMNEGLLPGDYKEALKVLKRIIDDDENKNKTLEFYAQKAVRQMRGGKNIDPKKLAMKYKKVNESSDDVIVSEGTASEKEIDAAIAEIMNSKDVDEFFDAIEDNDAAEVRKIVSKHIEEKDVVASVVKRMMK